MDAYLTRRGAIGAIAAGSLAPAVTGAAPVRPGPSTAAATQDGTIHAHRGPLKQSICRWCYGGMDMKTLCAHAVELGYRSIEILSEPDWAIVREHGLDCAVANGPVSIGGGINRADSRERFVADCKTLLPKVRDAGIPNMIIFSGNRHPDLSDEQGLENCAAAIEEVVPLAEETGVTVIMELLNSKVDHGGYMCDRTPWGVKLVQRIGSDRFKLLYDIYHMQIMEGDVIRTIRDNHQHIAHYHTGGVPGRREIDETQELYYPAICKAIVETGYTGFLGQEFIPSRDPVASLRQAFGICNV